MAMQHTTAALLSILLLALHLETECTNQAEMKSVSDLHSGLVEGR